MLIRAGWAFAVFAALVVPCRGQNQLEPELFLSGMAAMTATSGDEGAFEGNSFRRGDNAFGHLRFTGFGDVVFNARLALLNQLIIDPAARAHVSTYLRTFLRYALLSRPAASLQLQAGKLPTAFGSFAPRAYADRNMLIGLPLLYSYFTALRSNQLPADNDELLRHRGSGLAARFAGYRGSSAPNRNGLPLIYDACWDFGLQLVGSAWRFEYLVGLTQGTLSDPRTDGTDNNDGKQLVGRLAFVPRVGVLLGASFARGPYLDQGIEAEVTATGANLEDFDQRIYGFDVEYGVRHLRVIAELAVNRWEALTRNAGSVDLESLSWYLEASYKLRPGLTAAVRYGHLDFGKIASAAGNKADWDYDVGRSELGLRYMLTAGMLGKLVWQRQATDAPGVGNLDLAAVQMVASF